MEIEVITPPTGVYFAEQGGRPKPQQLVEPSLEEQFDNIQPSELTEEALSDVSDDGYKQFVHQDTTSKFGSAFAPLVFNQLLRKYTVINAVCWGICLGFGFYGLWQVFTLYREYDSIRDDYLQDIPCIYEWTEWSKCSASCRTSKKEYPKQQRVVKRDSIIEARGSYVKSASCNSTLMGIIQKRPCNVHKCPVKLGSLSFRKECITIYADEADEIHIDTNDLYKPCTYTTTPVTTTTTITSTVIAVTNATNDTDGSVPDLTITADFTVSVNDTATTIGGMTVGG
ncbi:unnamed protein product [Bursaphelenchus okinawaensis]|uniref:Uncharacterized protein n=1 Tax=Bursaphelenchus okinawaensis TaxID=465554 RepID=A0A811KM02_9BILA|nr:unnamed protein product [Bursaphelenchus okinawaensis]CAG9106077.1 unnamed protein product [Bursaphelenchus okinawaensis]